jgi:hypothetical protein
MEPLPGAPLSPVVGPPETPRSLPSSVGVKPGCARSNHQFPGPGWPGPPLTDGSTSSVGMTSAWLRIPGRADRAAGGAGKVGLILRVLRLAVPTPGNPPCMRLAVPLSAQRDAFLLCVRGQAMLRVASTNLRCMGEDCPYADVRHLPASRCVDRVLCNNSRHPFDHVCQQLCTPQLPHEEAEPVTRQACCIACLCGQPSLASSRSSAA